MRLTRDMGRPAHLWWWLEYTEPSHVSLQIAEERIGNIRTVRAFSAEKLEERRYTNKVDGVMNLAYKDALAKAGFFGSVSAVIAL